MRSMSDAYCYKCGTTEDLTPPRPGSRSTICHACDRERQINNRKKKRPEVFILYRTKGGAKVRGIEFSLTEADLPPIPEYCPVFPWIKLVYAVGEGRSDGSLSLDRIDSSRGYVPGNIRFISDRANRLKSDASDQELAALGRDADKRISKQ